MPYRIQIALQSAGITDTLRWIRDSIAQDPEAAPKALFAGLFVILGALADGIGSVAFWGVTIFWVADMLGGTARALDKGERWDAGKALSGVLRYGVVMGAWAMAIVGQEMARESWGLGAEADWLVLAAGASVFLGSFTGQVGHFVPPVGAALERFTGRVFARAGKEKPPDD